MDTSSPRNGSYLVIAVGIVAVVSLITAIYGLTRANSVSKQMTKLDEIASRIDLVEQSVKTATGDARAARDRIAGLATEMQRDIGNEFIRVNNEMRRLEIAMQEAKKQAESGAVKSGGTNGGGSGGSGGPAPGTLTETGEYVVQQGDNFGKIAAKFGVSVSDIQAANPDVQPTKMRVGQKIRVPKKQ